MFDDLTSFVVDIGTHSSRLGYGGDDSPKIIAPSYISSRVTMGDDEKQYGAGDKVLNLDRSDVDIQSIFKTNGEQISYQIDEDKFQDYLEIMLRKELKVNTKDYSLLFSEDVNLKPNELLAKRQKIAKIAFQKLGVPNIFFLKSPVLACFATGRSSAIVADSGQNSTRITVVHQGFVLNKLSKIVDCAGKQLSKVFQEQIQKQIAGPIKSRFQIKDSRYTQSFIQYHKKKLIEDIKASCSPNTLSNSQQSQQLTEKISYQLPDKQVISIQKSQIRDLFVSPSENYLSIPSLIVQTINSADVDIKRELYSNILMTGGNFLFNGHNLQNQVISHTINLAPPNVKVKSVSLCSNSERKSLSWIGGSIVSCLSAFQSYWIGKQEYLNGGTNVLQKKCI